MAASLVTFAQTDPSLTNAGVVHYTLTFSELVTGVDASAFTLTTSGVTGASIASVAEVALSGGTQYVVAVNTGSGNGTVALNLVGASIRDGTGNGLPGGTFLPQVTYASTSDPWSVAIADLNGDGKLDLAVADIGSNTVSVLLGNGNGTFQAQTSYATEIKPISVAVADLNGDGKPDLAVANEDAATVSVLLGNGDGTFQAQVHYAAGSTPAFIAIGDLNGDNIPDLAVAAYNSHAISVLLGNGNGTFQTKTAYATASNPYWVGIGDLNGDGKLDLAAADSTSNAVSVLLGNGDGTFQTRVPYATGTTPHAAAIADLNGDGRLDLAVANYGSDTISVLLGNGDGTFQTQTTYATGQRPDSVAIADLNGDGKPDLVVSNEFSFTVSALLGNGDGTFQTKNSYATGAYPQSVAIGDLTGDGRPDLAVANANSGTVSVFVNTPSTVVGAAYTIDHTAPAAASIISVTDDVGPVTGALTSGAITDDPDLTVKVNLTGTGALAGDTVQLYDGTGTASQLGTSYQLTPADISAGFANVQTGNLTDGTTYAVTARITDQAGNQSAVSTNTSTVTADTTEPSAPSITSVTDDVAPGIGTLLSGASTNDHNLTVHVSLTGTGAVAGDTLQLYDGTGTGNPLGSAHVITGAEIINGVDRATGMLTDGTTYGITARVTDQLGRQSAASSTFTLTEDQPAPQTPPALVSFVRTDPSLTNAGVVHYTLTFSELVTGVDASDFTLTSSGLTGASIASVDAVAGSGGTQYIVAVDTGSGSGTIGLNLVGASIRDGAGNPLPGGTFLPQATYATGSGPISVAVRDLNGDGKLDLATANYYANTVSVLLGNGDGTFQTQASYATGSAPYLAAIEDLNGDGRLDLAVANEFSNTVSVLLGNGDGTFQAQTSYASGANPVSVAIGDMNGDRVPDFAVANIFSHSISVLLGNGNGTFQSPATYSVDDGPELVAIADLNGDGKLDLAVSSLGTNSVSVLLGNGDGTFQAQISYAAGTGRSVAIADLNGDGSPDLASVNQSLQTVSVLLGNGDGSFQPQTTYATGAAPTSVAISDLNGDGRLDLAVTNANPNTVSLLLGNGDGTFQAQVTYSTGVFPWFVAIGDLDGDGRPDLAVANLNSDTVSVLINTPSAVAGPSYTIDRVAPTIAVAATLAGDNVVNLAEAAAGFAITGTSLGADGRTATITIVDGGNTVIATYTPLIAAGGAWTVAVSAADATLLSNGASYTVKADVSDAAGNPAVGGTRSITVDLTADGDTAATLTANDLLISNGEKSSVPVTVAGLDADATAVITFTDSHSHTAFKTVSGNGQVFADLSGLNDGTITTAMVITDAAGNTANVTGANLVLNAAADLVIGIGPYNRYGGAQLNDPAFTTVTLLGGPGALGTVNFGALGTNGIDVIKSSTGALVLKVDQYNALGSVALSSSDVVTIRDTGAKLATLNFAGLAGNHVDILDSTTALTLTVAQYNGLGAVALTAPDIVTLSVANADVGSINFGALAGKGIDIVDAADGTLALSIAQAQALGSVKLSSDPVIVADTAAALQGLGTMALTALATKGVDALAATDGALSLTKMQYQSLGAMTLSATGDVIVADTGALLGTLTSTQIGGLATAGVDRLDATNNALKLNVAQYGALGSVALSDSDVVTLADVNAAFSGLDFSGLGSAGVSKIDAAGDNTLTISLTQYNDLGAVVLTNADTVALAGTGSALTGLMTADFAALAGRGIDKLDVTAGTGPLAMELAEFNALGTVIVSPDDALVVNGTGGNDIFSFSRQTFTGNDEVVGGAGTADQLSLSGDYSAGLVFGVDALSGVERVSFAAGHGYKVTTDNGNVDIGKQLLILNSADSLIFDGSVETNGTFNFKGGAGSSTFTGGTGADQVTAGSGADTVRYTAAAQSTLGSGYGSGYDTVSGFEGSVDHFALATSVSFDATDVNNKLGSGTFNTDMADAMAQVAAGHAAIFTADSGNLAGVTFLLANDIGGTGSDLMVRLNGSSNITQSSFTMIV